MMMMMMMTMMTILDSLHWHVNNFSYLSFVPLFCKSHKNWFIHQFMICMYQGRLTKGNSSLPTRLEYFFGYMVSFSPGFNTGLPIDATLFR